MAGALGGLITEQHDADLSRLLVISWVVLAVTTLASAGLGWFVANASHELRTPLTLERTLLQVVLADPNATPATLRAACEELLASGRDQERLLEALLMLASSERGLEHREPVDLAEDGRRVAALGHPDLCHLSTASSQQLTDSLAAFDLFAAERVRRPLDDRTPSAGRPTSR